MLNYSDIEYRNIVMVRSLKQKNIRWGNGFVVITDAETGTVLTRLSCHKILIMFIIGSATITTPLIERCKKYQIPLVFTKDNFRTIAFIGNELGGNYLLRRKQYRSELSLLFAKEIIANKIQNQLTLLKNVRDKDSAIKNGIRQLGIFCDEIAHTTSIAQIMGFEGNAARVFFQEYYGNFGWKGRKPRVKSDFINVILDIGYTFLFHYVEVMLQIWGFDLYIGHLHQQWFQRKSLVCDLVEPFRCIIDYQVRLSLALQQFQPGDFGESQGRYYVKLENNRKYSEVFLNCIQDYKAQIYYYIRDYYRYFMGMKSVPTFPQFSFGKNVTH
ncbi:type V CRISPR-associated endonuclease Cas1 [Candidatus Haliotispira prima]|uniref:CRISPR-associated endonuclease Cas1 n=1 Tax=Candidatus Haliotispira prima TaxID=3034016 RepID=A0ABY8ME04_9SPIO|nr:type V CRISPR-associated endonuclease Cas1 [Candidatus Haliotispira prima]